MENRSSQAHHHNSIFLPVQVVPGGQFIQVPLYANSTTEDAVRYCSDVASLVATCEYSLVGDFSGFGKYARILVSNQAFQIPFCEPLEKHFQPEERLYNLVRKQVLRAGSNRVHFFLRKRKKRAYQPENQDDKTCDRNNYLDQQNTNQQAVQPHSAAKNPASTIRRRLSGLNGRVGANRSAILRSPPPPAAISSAARTHSSELVSASEGELESGCSRSDSCSTLISTTDNLTGNNFGNPSQSSANSSSISSHVTNNYEDVVDLDEINENDFCGGYYQSLTEIIDSLSFSCYNDEEDPNYVQDLSFPCNNNNSDEKTSFSLLNDSSSLNSLRAAASCPTSSCENRSRSAAGDHSLDSLQYDEDKRRQQHEQLFLLQQQRLMADGRRNSSHAEVSGRMSAAGQASHGLDQFGQNGRSTSEERNYALLVPQKSSSAASLNARSSSASAIAVLGLMKQKAPSAAAEIYNVSAAATNHGRTSSSSRLIQPKSRHHHGGSGTKLSASASAPKLSSASPSPGGGVASSGRPGGGHHPAGSSNVGAKSPIGQLPSPSVANSVPSYDELYRRAEQQKLQIEANNLAIAQKEARLRVAKQQEALAAHKALSDRLRLLRDRVSSEETQLQNLRQLRGNFEHHQAIALQEGSELENVRLLFAEKEAELSRAVARVEELTKQLEELKQQRGSFPPNNGSRQKKLRHSVIIDGNNGNVANASSQKQADLERFKQELAARAKINEESRRSLRAQQQLLAKRQEELSQMDRQCNAMAASSQQPTEAGSVLPEARFDQQQTMPPAPLANNGNIRNNSGLIFGALTAANGGGGIYERPRAAVEPFNPLLLAESSSSNSSTSSGDENFVDASANSLKVRTGQLSQSGSVVNAASPGNGISSSLMQSRGYATAYETVQEVLNKEMQNSTSEIAQNASMNTDHDIVGQQVLQAPVHGDKFNVWIGNPDKRTNSPMRLAPFNSASSVNNNSGLTTPASPNFASPFGKQSPLSFDHSPPKASPPVIPASPRLNGASPRRSSNAATNKSCLPIAVESNGKQTSPPRMAPNNVIKDLYTRSKEQRTSNALAQYYQRRGNFSSGQQQPMPNHLSDPSLVTNSSSRNAGILASLTTPGATERGGSLSSSTTDDSSLSGSPKWSSSSRFLPPMLPEETAQQPPDLIPPGERSRLSSGNYHQLHPQMNNFYGGQARGGGNGGNANGSDGDDASPKTSPVLTQSQSMRGVEPDVLHLRSDNIRAAKRRSWADHAANSEAEHIRRLLHREQLRGRTHINLSDIFPGATIKEPPSYKDAVEKLKSDSNNAISASFSNVEQSVSSALPASNLRAAAESEQEMVEVSRYSPSEDDAMRSGGDGLAEESQQDRLSSLETDSLSSGQVTVIDVCSPEPIPGVSSDPSGQSKKPKGILKPVGAEKTGRGIRFDPMALLLDAALEGELDLVKKSAQEVKNVSLSNDEGITALHNAICAGHYEIVRFLVEADANINAMDSDGWTPLHCAASCNNLPMVKFLVEHGACVFATTLSDHETPADKCEEEEDGFDGCSQFLLSIQEKMGTMNNGRVYAAYDYEAACSDELSFHDGDEMVVVRRNEMPGWWTARLANNREGFVPRNYLALYPRKAIQRKLLALSGTKDKLTASEGANLSSTPEDEKLKPTLSDKLISANKDQHANNNYDIAERILNSVITSPC